MRTVDDIGVVYVQKKRWISLVYNNPNTQYKLKMKQQSEIPTYISIRIDQADSSVLTAYRPE
jgi:hypothetical protein